MATNLTVGALYNVRPIIMRQNHMSHNVMKGQEPIRLALRGLADGFGEAMRVNLKRRKWSQIRVPVTASPV